MVSMAWHAPHVSPPCLTLPLPDTGSHSVIRIPIGQRDPYWLLGSLSLTGIPTGHLNLYWSLESLHVLVT